MAFDLAWQDNSVSAADASSYSFTSQTFGAVASAGETRYIVVGAAASDTLTNNPTPSITTIGGIAGTNVVAGQEDQSGVRIGIAAVPTGTTGTVVIDVDTTAEGCGIDVYRMIDPVNATP